MPDAPDLALPPLPTLRSPHDVLIVVPTCGSPATVVPGVRRLLKHTDGLRVRLLVVGNPDDPVKWAEARGMMLSAAAGSDAELDLCDLGHPVGFGAAVNAGIARYRSGFGPLPEHVVVINDDAHVSAGWLSGLIAALDPVDGVVLTGEPPDERGVRARRDPALAVGRIGMVGPVSNLVAGVAQLRLPDDLRRAPYDVISANVRQQSGGDVEVVDFLSGFCVLYRRECLLDLLADDGDLFDPVFKIGGYEDNDVCVRAELAGWGRVVARSVYVHHDGHQTLDRIAPGAKRGMANRGAYLDKWAGTFRTTGTKLVALYRVKLETAQDLAYLRASISRMGELGDGIAILLNGNPLEMTGSPDFAQIAPSLPPDDHALLRGCSGKDRAGVAAEVAAWATAAAKGGTHARGTPLGVVCEVWAGDFNERDERNHLIGMGEALGADWLFSVDHDEVPEGRVERATVERLMRTPDPLVYSWDVAFTTLWDSPRTQRVDRPWGDGGSYQGGMRGFRLFRASASPRRPRRIAAGNEIGLHCGNVPDADPLAKRVSSIRMLHFGYVRRFDRVRKHARYQRLDPNPNKVATGGGYAHLVGEENMTLSPVVSVNAIGLTMMLHAGETAQDLARQLDQYHGLVDAAVLVWTGEWDADDPSSGPSDAVRQIAAAYGATWVHRPLADDFASARNAGLEALRAVKSPVTGSPIAWALVVDPDELLADTFGDIVAIRRMAECSDGYGFLFRFANHRPAASGEPPTLSEAIRFVRLDPAGLVRYSGRVHEGFDAAFREIEAAGERPRVRYAPFTAHNPGLGTDPAELERKVRFYQRLLVAELADNPRNASAWCSLGMQFTNDGHEEKAVECFRRAIASDPTGFLAYRELGLAKLREGRTLFEMVARLLPTGHDYHRVAAAGAEWLGRFAPDQPLVGLAARGPEHVPPESDVELPPFPVIEDADNPFAGLVGDGAGSNPAG